MIEINKIYNDDCFNLLPLIGDNSVDLVILDPPFGLTTLDWDKVLDINKLWLEYNRITKENSAILIFGQEPFSSFVRLSNVDDYKYDWYWIKERLTNVFQVKRRPGKVVETISVFYKQQCKYFPQKTKFNGKKVTNKIGEKARWSETMAGKVPNSKPFEYIDNGTRHPTQVLNINRENLHKTKHPCQKPIELLEYLIKTYTLENDLVLDCCCGVGSVCVAAKNLKRNFIGIEKISQYYTIAQDRLK